MDPDQQMRNVSRINVSAVFVMKNFRRSLLILTVLSCAAAGFSPGLQPHDGNLLPAMQQQLQLQKPHHGRGTGAAACRYILSCECDMHDLCIMLFTSYL